ncbi:MAG: hypothetical protein OFPI_38460 [Osedax symbiont Rs2]|nr:MAG: hypothetical protein OFPI_38460 [Osedax symbiont Rs2]
MQITDFSSINNASALSFKQQKNMIKKLGKGATIPCDNCRQPLKLVTPKKGDKHRKTGVSCAKGCTDIELEFSA